jgi:hypothetical protein
VFDLNPYPPQPTPPNYDKSRDLFLHSPPLEYRTYNMSGGQRGCSFAVFWPNNVHQPGVTPNQQQQRVGGVDALELQSSSPPVLKVVIKFRISSSKSRIGHYTDRVTVHDIPQHTASSASCMGMASPYHHPHQDTPGTSGSEQVLHRNVWPRVPRRVDDNCCIIIGNAHHSRTCSHVRRRTCLLRNVCRGPKANQILYFEDPVISALPQEHTIAGLQGGLGSLNAWTYTEEETAQGWNPTVVKGALMFFEAR